jgi:hypothetical protein
MTPDPTVTAVSDGALTEMRDRFRESARPDKRQYAELFDELLRARSALAWAAGELTLRELVRGAMALIEGPTLLTEDNCDEWLRRARSALADVGEKEFTKGGGLSCEGATRADVRGDLATEETGTDRPAAPISRTSAVALADVGECELCKGARFLPYFNGEVNPRCHVCKGTGKQPRPAAATLATTGHLLMPSLVSPAAHTAQDEREALLAGAALAMQRVLVVQPDAWDEVAHWKNVAATLRRLASTAERE